MEETREQREKRYTTTLLTKLTPKQLEEARKLDEFELYEIADMLHHNDSFPEAIIVYGNTVEGDMSQLSKEMKKLYYKYRKAERKPIKV